MELARDIASWLLLGGGAVLALISGIGMLRLPDVYTRMHAASLSDTGAAGLIAAGLMLQAPDALTAVKLLLILVFLFFTSPAATHALARAAWGDGIKPWAAAGQDGSAKDIATRTDGGDPSTS